jgi:hypothetical protein
MSDSNNSCVSLTWKYLERFNRHMTIRDLQPYSRNFEAGYPEPPDMTSKAEADLGQVLVVSQQAVKGSS